LREVNRYVLHTIFANGRVEGAVALSPAHCVFSMRVSATKSKTNHGTPAGEVPSLRMVDL